MNKRKPILAAGVDAGSSRTRCVILAVEDERVRYLGHGEHVSRGWIKGKLADQQSVAESVRWAVRGAEQTAMNAVESAVIGLGGPGVVGGAARWTYEFGRPRKLDTADLEYAIRRASRVQMEEDRLLLQVFPQDFTVDGRAGFRNPKGMTAELMEAHVHLVTASVQEHQCLVNALHSASLGVEETVFEPMAAAYAALRWEERRQGVVLLDIGMQSTDIVVYHGDSLLCTTSIPMGGEQFTNDVAYGLTVAPEDAEQLKIQVGCAMVDLTSAKSIIEIPSPEGRPAREALRRDLSLILQVRAEELFEKVHEAIDACGMTQQLLQGALLTGGGSRLPGLLELAERVLGCPVRPAVVDADGIADLPEALEDPAWTTATGLAMYSARIRLRKESTKRAPGLLGLVFR